MYTNNFEEFLKSKLKMLNYNNFLKNYPAKFETYIMYYTTKKYKVLWRKSNLGKNKVKYTMTKV